MNIILMLKYPIDFKSQIVGLKLSIETNLRLSFFDLVGIDIVRVNV